MSKITIYNKENTKYSPNSREFGVLQTDYLGNVYLKYKNDYYIISLDVDNAVGALLTQVKYPEVFRKNLQETNFLRKEVKSGIIKSGHNTLRGRVNDSISNMTDEEIDDYVSKNDYMSYDPQFIERNYFWVQYQEDNEELYDEENNNFYLNGVIDESEMEKDNIDGIIYSDLLSLSNGTFDTILIKGDIRSKNVVSTIERIDGHCTSRLTVYTSGYIRANFFDRVKYSRLCIDLISDTLMLVVNDNM